MSDFSQVRWLSRIAAVVVLTLAGARPLAFAQETSQATDGSAADSHKSITNSIGTELVYIPAGEFKMGSGESTAALKAAFAKIDPKNYKDEHPRHDVRITRPFYMAVYPVTLGQFHKFVEETKYRTDLERDAKGGKGYTGDDDVPFVINPRYNWLNTGFEQTDKHPVVDVSWNDAVAFCRWISKKDGKKFRLPTEAEWEYAARAGGSGRYCFGDGAEADLAKHGNVADATLAAKLGAEFAKDRGAVKSSDGYAFTSPVGSFPANKWGLCDMSGNVAQWCSDWYDAGYYGSARLDDPQGPESGTFRVLRGATWISGPVSCRVAARTAVLPGTGDVTYGFRVVCEP